MEDDVGLRVAGPVLQTGRHWAPLSPTRTSCSRLAPVERAQDCLPSRVLVTLRQRRSAPGEGTRVIGLREGQDMPYVLASDEVPLYYTSHGQGPVIVLIHGFSMNGGFFRHNVSELARGHRVVTMDLRGHGHSGKQEHNWTLPQTARDVRALLEQLDLREVILIGWSMGATVNFNYLQQFGDDRLRGLGIIDMTPYLLTEPGWGYAAFHNTLSADAALGTVRDLWADRLAMLTNFVSACFAEGTDPDPDTVDH